MTTSERAMMKIEAIEECGHVRTARACRRLFDAGLIESANSLANMQMANHKLTRWVATQVVEAEDVTQFADTICY